MQFNNVILTDIFVANEGQLWTVGQNVYGSLGDGTGGAGTSKSSPVQTIAGGTNWRGIASLASYACGAIKSDGTLWTWGWNTYGQLGTNDTTNRSSPVQIHGGGNTWKQVAMAQSSAAIKTDGTLWVWGTNYFGTLGINSSNNIENRSSPVQTIAGGTNWKKVAVSSITYAMAAIKTDGTLWVWGRNNKGQLGTNNTTFYSSPVQTIAGGTNWKDVCITGQAMVATKTDGTLWTWGQNNYGGLGTNDTTDRSSPVQTISAGTNWSSIGCGHGGAGSDVTVGATKTDGTLWMWGANSDGQLGTNDTTPRSSPVQTIAGGTNWKQTWTSGYFSTGIKTDGTLWVWGWNGQGGLGDGTTTNRSSPVQSIDGGNNWLEVSAGAVGVVALSYVPYTFGTIYGWGDNNSYGQLGVLTQTTKYSSPVQISGGGYNWAQVSYGGGTSHAIKTDGTLWGWGFNQNNGTIGDGTLIPKSSPVQIGMGINWAQVSSGLYNTGAIKTDGTLWMWGGNSYGGLGTGNTQTYSSPVQTIAGGTNWKQVNAGYTSGATKTDGTLWVWGQNQLGQLGLGNTVNCSSPTQLGANTNWNTISFFKTVSAGIKTDGTLWMWGSNYFGQLGNNNIIKQSSPVQTIAGGTNWKQVSVLYNNTAAIKTDGTLWTWGLNSYGALGDGTTTDRSSPVQTIAGGTNWKKCAASNQSAGAIKTDGTLWMWGNNPAGQLGDGTIVNKSSPIQIGNSATWIDISAKDNSVLAIAY